MTEKDTTTNGGSGTSSTHEERGGGTEGTDRNNGTPDRTGTPKPRFRR